ncbi:MAG: hypothetical protein Ta2G_19070 [Termitinemataceae bacterium]|nr:MAG: hypothetical protein Ta2G_19070 [Termitinemataceae bacterium]
MEDLGFFAKNRKAIVNCIIVVLVIVVGVIVALSVLEMSNKSAISKLELLVTRYDEVKGSFADAETSENAELDSLANDLKEFGEKNRFYPAARAFIMASEIYKSKKQWSQAQESFEAAAKKGKNTHIEAVSLFNAAVAAEEQDKMEDAAKLYERSASFADFSGASHALFSLGRIKETSGDKEAALSIYRDLSTKWPSSAWADLAMTKILALEIAK